MEDLKHKKCTPCEGGIKPFNREKINYYLNAAPDWEVIEDKIIKKEFSFKNFAEAVEFVNKVANLAEEEGHHPDISLHNWNKVTLILTTHAINGLSSNDFIMAVKIDLIQ